MIFLSVDDDQWEPDEEFFLKISLTNNEADADILKIGRKHIMTIKFATNLFLYHLKKIFS